MMPLTSSTYSGLGDQVKATLGHMNRLMNEWSQDVNLIRLARWIVSGCNDREAEAETVRLWVKSEIEYRMDPADHELLQDPIVTLSERAGDCDDMATLAGALLRAVGHPCHALGVTWAGQEGPTHAVVYDEAAGVVVDPVAWVDVASWPPSPHVVAGFEGA